MESSGEDSDDEVLNIGPVPGLHVSETELSSNDDSDDEEDEDSEDSLGDSSNYLTGEDSDEESHEMESESDDDAVEPMPSLPHLNDDDDLGATMQQLFLSSVDIIL